jgi:hypothetical protein
MYVSCLGENIMRYIEYDKENNDVIILLH